MRTLVANPQKVKRVLLIADTEETLRTEVQTLTALGVAFFHYTASIDESLTTLHRSKGPFRFDAVICAETLADESIYCLLHRLATEPSLADTPLLVVSSTEESAALMQESGLVGVSRPYSQAAFGKGLEKATSPTRAPLSAQRMAAVCARLTQKKRLPQGKPRGNGVQTTSDIMREGIRHLQRGAFETAEDIFVGLVKRSYDNGEAYLGLARAQSALQKKQEAMTSLLKAAAAFTRQKKEDRAKAVTALLPERWQTGDIFLHEASACLRTGEYREAALGILEHLYAYPEARLHLVVGRLCQLTESPNESLRNLCETYTHLGYTSIAQRLHTQLMADMTPVEYFRKSSWLDRHPKLREIIEVASYTTALWRQA